MTIADILEFARERIPLEIAKDENRLQTEIAKIRSEHAARGMLLSGNFIIAIENICANAARGRIKSAWEVLHRGITTVGIEYDTEIEAQLRVAIESYFPEHMNGLQYRVVEAAKQAGMPDIISRMPDEVGKARRAALAEVASEIRLFVLTLKKRPVQIPYSPQFNFHNSTIGALQTGDQSTANVQFQTGVASEDLIKALDIVLQSLDGIGDIPGQNKAEIIELVADGKSELAKEKPNQTKLGSYLGTIGQALSIVANLKPAYEGLKTAANACGFHLP